MTAPWVYVAAATVAAATIYGAARFFGKRVTDSEEEETPKLEVLSRTPVGLGGSLVLVRFEGRRILLGVTRGQWTALADLGRGPSGEGELSVIDAELNRALEADRLRRGRKGH
ncbi:MAG TPA: flagellar biosynthetic protein FliO [Candidatus Polarisedimenticolia bacterium]|nr:flagellar biosynthetic protein FliO [Candidatus Polarisedimenticolia bacterium]